MIKTLSVLFFFISLTSISQNLEEQIYTATEQFIADKTPHSFQKIDTEEKRFKNNVSTKDEHLALVFLSCNKGYYLNETNKQGAAIYAYEEAWERYKSFNIQSISNYDIIEYCLKPLGNLYTKTNNYTSAENTIKQYIAIAQTNKNQQQEIAGLINLSALYQSLGKHQSVLNITKKTKKFSEIQPKQAEKLARLEASSKIALDRKLLSNDLILPDISIRYNQHQIAYERALKNSDYKTALKHFNLTSAFSKKDTLSRRQLAKRHLEKAQLHYLLGDTESTETMLHRALQLLISNYSKKHIPEPTSLYPENTFIDIFDFLARLQSNPEKALAYYDLSFYVSELFTENITSQEGKITNQINNRIRSEYTIERLYNMYQNNASNAIFNRALEYAEANKAAILKSNYSKQSLLEQHPKDTLLLKEQNLLKTQEQLTSSLIKKQLGYETNSNDSLNKQLLDISITLKKIKKQIDHVYPNSKNNLSLQKLQKQLKTDNAILIEYFYGSRAIYQFIISANHVRFLKINLTANFKNSLSSFIHLFDNASAINNNVAAYTKLGYELYKLLGMKETGRNKNVVIIPDGLLNFVPFEALLTEDTSGYNFSKMPFMVTSKNVVYNSSLAFYLMPQNITKSIEALGVFPVFENTSQPLSYSTDESESLQKHIETTLLMQTNATKTAFLDAISDYSILHLSTHATSGDFINPANIAFYDQPLLLHEIYGLKINPNLVVLSACETGVGKLQKGEGAMSIARGFQYAGARNILFSLWQINDASTSKLMSNFYKDYASKKSVSHANRFSKLAYLKDETISDIKKSPYYWSAFVYYGNFTKEKQNWQVFYYLIGVFAVVFIVFLRLRKRKKHE
ncbi:CHAT domain-containing protein [Bizionia sp. KMM 8389]